MLSGFSGTELVVIALRARKHSEMNHRPRRSRDGPLTSLKSVSMSWNTMFVLLPRLLGFVCPDSPSLTGHARGAAHPHDQVHPPACGEAAPLVHLKCSSLLIGAWFVRCDYSAEVRRWGKCWRSPRCSLIRLATVCEVDSTEHKRAGSLAATSELLTSYFGTQPDQDGP